MTLLRDEDLAAAFDHASRSYDTLVAANPGYHAHLRRSVRRLGLPGHGQGLRVLDLGCGTGASTAALRSLLPAADLTAVDASAGMLERAAAKPWAGGVRFVHAPAERPAAAGVDGPFDAVFAAYLFRNVSDPDAVLTAVRGLLRPGGRLGVHEYTLSGRRADRAVWTLVCRGVVQPGGHPPRGRAAVPPPVAQRRRLRHRRAVRRTPPRRRLRPGPHPAPARLADRHHPHVRGPPREEPR